jgi:histidyl-tRNA synthetase
MNKIQAVRGMNDLLPDEARKFNYVVQRIAQVVEAYGFAPIYFPLLEKTELFIRSIGSDTDVVAKEMYTFLDRNEESLTLRPEGTAGCVRAALEHGLLHNQTPKFWYVGPMFRYERPQKGRYRQFYQIGIEAFGIASPDLDAEIISMSYAFLKKLGLNEHIKLELNTLGQKAERSAYQQALVNYLQQHQHELDEDSQRRLTTNPLRILDSKVAATQALLKYAPKLNDYLSEETRAHFKGVTTRLDALGIAYTLNPHLVRGLDYYNLTAFEWTTDLLGAQATVCGGGRYDGLVAELSGEATPAFGFALGLERLLLLLDQAQAYPDFTSDAQVFLVLSGERAMLKGFVLAQSLRDQGVRVAMSYGEASFKNQFKKADKSGAAFALIMGEDEINRQQVSLKYLREERPQLNISDDQIITQVLDLIRKF